MLELSRLLGVGAVSNEHQTTDPEILRKEEASAMKEEEKAPMKKEAEDKKVAKASAYLEDVKILYEEQHIKGSYIIGGSPLQKNFVVYRSSSDPVFYGVTKEDWMAKLLPNSASKRS